MAILRNIIHISDTHNMHDQLNLPECEILIHSGDESNDRDPIVNEIEFRNFIEWFSKQKARVKILVPGNHSMFIYNNERYCKDLCKENRIQLLIKESYIDETSRLHFYGDPIVKKFRGYWAYEVDPVKTHKHFDMIPECDILITHMPPKNTLDFSIDKDRKMEMIGDKNLYNKVINSKTIKLHLFGHCHDASKITNFGVLKRDNKTFINSACAKDGDFDILKNKGHLIQIAGKTVLSISKL